MRISIFQKNNFPCIAQIPDDLIGEDSLRVTSASHWGCLVTSGRQYMGAYHSNFASANYTMEVCFGSCNQ